MIGESCAAGIAGSDCRPGGAELEEDVRIDASLDVAVAALTRPVSARCADRPEPAAWAGFGMAPEAIPGGTAR